ncbi:MAG: CapA family protein [Paludibacteraceae bacterium]|nr:CapA family protein [Paludibacteraceae bacterium]
MKVIIAGDFAPKHRLAKQIEKRDFQEIFSDNLVATIKSADYSLVNFESPIIEKDFKPIKKCGPNLGCTPDAADAIKYAGFTAVAMANNHILDYGADGLYKSIECCKNVGLDVVGVGKNLQEAEQILYIEKKGKKLAIINCCEHEFSIATETSCGANPLNPIRQYYCIQEAKKNADYVLVIVHGGHEHYQLPSPRMQETYRFFVDAGADAVVNHHQHCYSGYEIYNGKPIFYGLGNFCFDWEGAPSKKWTEGYLVEIDFDFSITFKIYPYCQYGDEATINLLAEDAFNDSINKLNEIISNPESLKNSSLDYYNRSKDEIATFLEPIRNRYIRGLQNRGLLPKLMNNKWLPELSNVVMCESHKDKLDYYLLSEIDKLNKQ